MQFLGGENGHAGNFFRKKFEKNARNFFPPKKVFAGGRFFQLWTLLENAALLCLFIYFGVFGAWRPRRSLGAGADIELNCLTFLGIK
jgi:hypothetical protein